MCDNFYLQYSIHKLIRCGHNGCYIINTVASHFSSSYTIARTGPFFLFFSIFFFFIFFSATYNTLYILYRTHFLLSGAWRIVRVSYLVLMILHHAIYELNYQWISGSYKFWLLSIVPNKLYIDITQRILATHCQLVCVVVNNGTRNQTLTCSCAYSTVSKDPEWSRSGYSLMLTYKWVLVSRMYTPARIRWRRVSES